MKIRFWGVRGSTPSFLPEHGELGGQTCCVALELIEQDLVLDAGTGFLNWNRRALVDRRPGTLLLSHLHWDHLEGLLDWLSLPREQRATLKEIVLSSLHKEAWERGLETLKRMWPRAYWQDLPPVRTLKDSSLKGISLLELVHPGGAFGYRVARKGVEVAYLCDHGCLPQDLERERSRLASLLKGVDCLIHDCGFSQEEYECFPSWGHSTCEQAWELAKKAGVHTLFAYHYGRWDQDEWVESCLRQPALLMAVQGDLWEVESGGCRRCN